MYPTINLKINLSYFLGIFLSRFISFANYSASFVDTAMTGRYNTMELAGVSAATSLWGYFNRDCFGHGSHHRPSSGTGQKGRSGIWLLSIHLLSFSDCLLVLLGMVVFLAPPVLNHIGLEAQVAAVAVTYLWYLSIGIIPVALSVIRSLLDSLGLTKLSMYLMLLILPTQ